MVDRSWSLCEKKQSSRSSRA